MKSRYDFTDREKELRAKPFPPHDCRPYDCVCIACDAWRFAQLNFGDLVFPTRLDQKHYRGLYWDIKGPVIWDHSWELNEFAIFCDMIPPGHPACYRDEAGLIYFPKRRIQKVAFMKSMVRWEDFIKRDIVDP